MKVTAQDLKELGVIDTIVPEPLGGAHRDPAAAIAAWARRSTRALGELDDADAASARGVSGAKNSWRWAARIEAKASLS